MSARRAVYMFIGAYIFHFIKNISIEDCRKGSFYKIRCIQNIAVIFRGIFDAVNYTKWE